MHGQAIDTMLLKHTLWAAHTRHDTGQRAEVVENRAEDRAYRGWQQYSHVNDNNHTSGPESDDLALDGAAALSCAGAVAKL